MCRYWDLNFPWWYAGRLTRLKKRESLLSTFPFLLLVLFSLFPTCYLKGKGNLGKPSLKKKCNIFYTQVWPPPYFPESVTKIQKKNKAFKMQYQAILDHVLEKKKVTKTGPDPPPNVKNVVFFLKLPLSL